MHHIINKLIVVMLIPAILLSAVPIALSADSINSSDILSHMHKYEISKMLEKGVVTCRDDGNFYPDEYITRGEFAVMTAALFRQQGAAAEVFSDIKAGDECSGAVNALNSLNLIPHEMLSDGAFMPDSAIKRQEAAAILYNAFVYAYEYENESIVQIKDISDVPSYALDAVLNMCALGFMHAADGNFLPGDSMTRADAAVTAYDMFYTSVGYTLKNGPGTYEDSSLSKETLAAYNRGARKVIIQPGEYHLYKPSSTVSTEYRYGYFGLHDISDFEIDGTGVKFIGHNPAHTWQVANNGISILSFYRCDNLTLRGFTCDYAELLYTQGEIVDITEEPEGSKVTVQIDEGYSDDFENRGYFPATVVGTLINPDTLTYKETAPNVNIKPVEKVDGFDGRWIMQNSNATANKYMEVGDLISIRMSQCGAFTVTGRQCNNFLLDDITVHAGYYGVAMGMSMLRGENTADDTSVIRNVKITYGDKPEGASRRRLTSTMADGINAGHRSGDLLIEDCYVEGNTDDCISLGSRSYVIMDKGEAEGSYYIGTPGYPETVTVGDTLAVYDTNSNHIGNTTITKVESAENYTPPDDVAVVSGFEIDRIILVTVSNADIMKRTWFAFNTDACSKGVVIRNCTVRDNNGRGILTQTWNTLIENCTFINNAKAGYFPVAEKHCLQGPHANGVVVRGCTFTRCNRKAENTPSGLYKPGGAISTVLNETGRGNADVLIENCSFNDNYGADILLGNTRGAIIRNNTFGRRNSLTDVKGICNDASVRITNSEDVVFKENTSLSDRIMMTYQDVDNLQSDYKGVYSSEFTLDIVNDGSKEWSYEYAPIGENTYNYYDYQYWTSGAWVRVVPLWSKDKSANTDYGYIQSLYEVSPGSENDFTAAFRAPYTGRVKIMFNDGLSIKEGCYKSDGVNIRLIKNTDEQIWPESGWETVNYGEKVAPEDVYVDVKKGDILRFRVNSNGSQTHDTLLFSPEIRYTGVLINKTYAKIEMNDTLKLNAVLSDLSGSADVTWSSTDEGVAAVDNTGKVKPISSGTALIKATASDGTFAKCTVDVYDERLYFEDTYETVDRYSVYDPTSMLRGTYASEAVITYIGGRNVQNGDMSLNGVRQEPMIYDHEKSAYIASYNGLAEFTATAEVDGENVTAVMYVSVGEYGADLVNTLQLAYSDTNHDRSSNQFLWKMGYMDNGEFAPYNTYSTQKRGFQNENELNAKGGVYLVDKIAHNWRPGNKNDSVIVWKAPETGVVTLNGGVAYKAQIRTKTEEAALQEHSVTLTISHDGKTLFNEILTGASGAKTTDISSDLYTLLGARSGNYQCTGTNTDIGNLSVQKGDEIYFILSSATSYLTLNQSYFGVDYILRSGDIEEVFGIEEEQISIAEGMTETLTATKCSSFSSSNENVAVVDSIGNVTAISEGTAVIYALSSDGSLADECYVTVGDWGMPVLNKGNITIEATTAESRAATVIVAVKDDISLKKAYMATLSGDLFTVNNAAVEQGDSVIIFIWENLKTIKPLKKPIVVKVE